MTIYAYASIEQLREYLPQIATGPANDNALARILQRARSAIDTELRFSFFDIDTATGAATAWPSASSRICPHVPSDNWLRLPAYKQGSVTSVSYLDSLNATHAITDYIEDWNGGQFSLYRAADTSVTPYQTTQLWVNSPYTVTAIWGYGPPIPAIEELNLELAVNIWRTREKGSFVEAQGQNSTTIKAVGALSDQQKAVLANVNRLYVDWIDWGRP